MSIEIIKVLHLSLKFMNKLKRLLPSFFAYPFKQRSLTELNHELLIVNEEFLELSYV